MSEPGQVKFDSSFVLTKIGLVTSSLILFLFCTMVSIASVPKTPFLSLLKRSATEEALLFFTIVGLFIEIAYLILSLFNVLSLNFFRRLPMHIIIVIKNTIFLISIFGLAISCSVLEANGANYDVFNKGAYAAAAFFGFCSFLLYIMHSILALMKHLREGN